MEITKKDLQDALRAQTKELKAHAVAQTEELAQMVKRGFDGVGKQIDVLRAELNVSKQLLEHERKFRKLEKTLNVRL